MESGILKFNLITLFTVCNLNFTRVLAAEEPALTVVTVRPGVVNSDMQAYIRRKGPEAMPAGQVAYYRNLKDHGELALPEIPGRSIAWLALFGAGDLSGGFLDYDDPRISRPALEIFGDRID